MLTSTQVPASATSTLPPRITEWHRPLLRLAIAMAVLAAISAVGIVVDSREVTGVNLWLKPLKFALSIGIYSVTLSWLIGQLRRMRRFASIAGTVSVAGLLIEIVIIVGFAIAGDTSHFNVSTPFHTTMWSVMAVSIIMVWTMTLLVSIALFRNPLGDRARTLAIRAGAIIGLVGMGVAFFMTSPTAGQLDSFDGIAGAHTVGLPDGGPGLPLLGWSTEAGDLRIPHFIGMHALQLIPLAAILIDYLARKVATLHDVHVRHGLVWVVSASYSAALILLTVQALRGQSIVAPDAWTQVAATLIILTSVAASVVVVVRGRRRETTLT
ncbi:MAG: hypothetical protein ACOH1J_02255 [Microbacteriaceae bacterium]